MRTRYRIHPAIGVARVGDADDRGQFFIGPEYPGVGAEPDPPRFKTDAHQVRPQAARFRIFEYRDGGDGKFVPVREMTLDEPDVAAIQWTVHLANRKASFHRFEGLAGESRPPGALRNATVADRASLEIDPGARTIAGRKQTGATFTPGTSASPAGERWPRDPSGRLAIDYLGELRTDESGRLVVIGGKGRAASIAPNPRSLGSADDTYAFANNDSWLDDVSDGPVTATVTLRGAAPVAADGAWVLVGPPDFAPAVGNVVTLYDVLYDMAARTLALPADDARFDRPPLDRLKRLNAELRGRSPVELKQYRPSFADEIWPILRRASENVWVFRALQGQHTSAGATPDRATLAKLADPASAWLGQYVLSFLRPPAGTTPAGTPAVPATKQMPKLFGDGYDHLPSDPRALLTLTPTQYALLRRWSEGAFDPPPSPDAIGFVGTNAPRAITPEGLDQAALENCVGGAFYPGIEVSWQIRAPSLYSEPFRLDPSARSAYSGETQAIAPGHFTRQMSVPWQSDFYDCSGDSDSVPGEAYGWWPAQRPDDVYREGATFSETPPAADKAPPMTRWSRGVPTADDFARLWSRMGFVVRRDSATGAIFVETERDS